MYRRSTEIVWATLLSAEGLAAVPGHYRPDFQALTRL